MSDASINGGVEARGSEWIGATHWSVILAARQEGSPAAAAALERLCQTYWYPLYAYVRRRGFEVPEAQDLTQGFFAQLLADKSLLQVDPARGRFRAFLIAALNHYLANYWKRAHAAKRGGGKPLLSLDDTAEARYAEEPRSDATPEKLYERRWALSLFEQAMAELRRQYAAAGKAQQYQSLEPFLSSEPGPGDYGRVAAELGISQAAVSASVRRLRLRYRELVRERVAGTVENPADVEDEIRALLAALGD